MFIYCTPITMMQHIYKSSATGEALLYAWFPAMHTRVDVALQGTYPESHLLALAHDIHHELTRLESIGNCFDPTSELSTLNGLAVGQSHAISPELYHILSLCIEGHTRTRGYFDIAIHSDGHTPDTMQAIRLQPDTIRFDKPGIRLNLSGFLKGYALDKIRPLVQGQGIRNALINLGNSSILAMGHQPGSQGWSPARGITLHDQCLTTSGNDTAQRRHIISPHTGRFIEGLGQLHVITPSGAWGEICSTALFAAPEDERPHLAEALRPHLISYQSPSK